MDLWNKETVKKEDLQIEMISKNAIRNGSGFRDKDEIESLRTNLAKRINVCELIVLSADIRKSSIALVNVEDFSEYSRVLTDFICYIKNTWCHNKKKGRFFDKFTGDGALFFWILPEEPKKDEDYFYSEWNLRIKEAIDFGIEIVCKFIEIFLPSVRRTCGLLPMDFGFSIGIDAGECFLTELKSSTKEVAYDDYYERKYGKILGGDKEIIVSDNVTMIGRPVIGATRMVEAAEPYEILVNCYPGAALKAKIDNPIEHKIREGLQFGLDLCFRKIKDYQPGLVEVYRVDTDRINGLKKKLGLSGKEEECIIKRQEEPKAKSAQQLKS